MFGCYCELSLVIRGRGRRGIGGFGARRLHSLELADNLLDRDVMEGIRKRPLIEYSLHLPNSMGRRQRRRLHGLNMRALRAYTSSRGMKGSNAICGPETQWMFLWTRASWTRRERPW